MPESGYIGDTFVGYMPLTPTEREVLSTLMSVKNGSAYMIRKASNLKHYSTVLRTLKKLEQKKYVESLTQMSGARGKRLYRPTLFGRLTHHILREETAQVINTLAANSRKFREMVDSNLPEIDKWAFQTANSIFWDIRGHIRDGSKQRTVDEIIIDNVLDEIRPELLADMEDESFRIIEALAKARWIRELAIREIDSMIEWHKKQTQMSKKLRDTLAKSKH